MLIISCGSSEDSAILNEDSALIWGSVDLAIPQDSANVKVYVGEKFVWEGMCADGDFSGHTDVPLGKDVRVVVTEDLAEGTPFHGTLSLYEEEYTPGEHLEVNLYTTLVDRTRLYYNISLEDADRAIKQHFNLPTNLNYAERLHISKMKTHFNSEKFLQSAYTKGTLDEYIDELVQGIMSNNTGAVASEPVLVPASVTEIAGVAGPTIGGVSLAYEVLKDFNVIHTENPVEDKLDDINDRLDEQTKKLNDMDDSIKKVLDATTEISEQINCSEKSILKIYLEGLSYGAENNINTQSTIYSNALDNYKEKNFNKTPLIVAEGIIGADLHVSIEAIKSSLVGTKIDTKDPGGALGQFAKELVHCQGLHVQGYIVGFALL